MLYGYSGKILHVNLSNGEIQKEKLDRKTIRMFLGGMGLGIKILYDEVDPELDPFDPGNVVIIAAGPLTGTAAPSSRIDLTTKSPLTGILGTANAGGFWGSALKYAGYDAIVIKGRSQRPVYLWIADGFIELRSAVHLWGNHDTWATEDAIREETEESYPHETRVLSIGPAGENLVRYASVTVDRSHVAARCGVGCVMGTKNLKAVAVRGTGGIHVAQPDRFLEALSEAFERIKSSPMYEEYRSVAVLPLLDQGVEKGAAKTAGLPGRHWQTDYLPNWIETRGFKAALKYLPTERGLACHCCPIGCFHVVEVNDGKYRGLRVNSGTFATPVIVWGANCDIASLPAIWKCKQVCDRLGLDMGSASVSIAFAMELYQRKIIGKKDTEGLKLEWGDDEVILQMLDKIAHRKGFGNILAEGVVEASRKIERGSEKYVVAIKRLEMLGGDPRSGARGWYFGYITSPRGGDNVKTTHVQAEGAHSLYEDVNSFVERLDMFEIVKREIYGAPPKMDATTFDGKAMYAKWWEDLTSVINALGLCIFPAGILKALGPTLYARLFSTCTGIDVTPLELMQIGERIFNLQRAYIARAGITRDDDSFPARFYEGAQGVLFRSQISRVLEEYYELRGWDKGSGIPTRAKLIELGLNDVADEIFSRAR